MYNPRNKYQINQSVKKMMEAKLGIKSDELSNVDAEVLIDKIIKKGEFDKERKFNNKEKVRLTLLLNNINPNKYHYKHLMNISKFVRHIYNEDELKDYVSKLVIMRYKPGFVTHKIRAVNEQIVLFLSLFHDYFQTIRGVIINPEFIGDVKKVYPDVKYDKDTGNLLEDAYPILDKLVKKLKNKYQDKIKIFVGNIYVFAMEDEKIIKEFENDFKGLKIEVIPEFYFDFK